MENSAARAGEETGEIRETGHGARPSVIETSVQFIPLFTVHQRAGGALHQDLSPE
jgi:hypothetical protein